LKGRSNNKELLRIISEARDSGIEVPYEKLLTGLTQEQAYFNEKSLITAIGRQPDEPLVNIAAGGAGAVGVTRSAEHRARIAEANRNRSPEVRAKIRTRISAAQRKIDRTKVFDLRAQGLTQQRIATALNCSQTAIGLILRAA
jgi:hypothetical protein